MSEGIVPDEEQIHTAEQIDWRALFEEFEMHTPNAVGELAVSTTTLHEGIRVSEQHIAGDPQEHIDDAVEHGSLIKEMVKSEDGQEMIRGYRLGSELA